MSDRNDSLDPNKTRLEPNSLPPRGNVNRVAPTQGPDEYGKPNRVAPTQGPGGGNFSSGGARPHRPAPTVFESAPPLLAWFAMVEGRRPGTIYQIHDGDTTLGRDSSCDILLDDERASSQHAKIKVERARGAEPGEEKFVLYDLASSNGTTINGKPALKEELFDNDRVKIGQSVLVFKRV